MSAITNVTLNDWIKQMSKCQGCGGGNAPHNESSKDHIDNMKKLTPPLSEFEKFFYLLNKGKVGVEFSRTYHHGGERIVDGFKIVIDD